MNRSIQGPRDTPNLYRAEVVDNEDPDRYFRVKLKIHGVTDAGTGKDNSVWAEVIQGTTPGIDKTIGVSSVLQVGTMVWCMLENNDPNKPVVVGVLSGKGDPSDALEGSKYIDAQSLYTKSGHKIIIDDSSGDEFIYIFHRTGTYIKIDHEGDIYVNGVRDAHYTIARDVTWDIGRDLTINVGRNESMTIGGTSTWDVTGDRSCTFQANETNTTKGDKTETTEGNKSETINGNDSATVQGNRTANYNSNRSETVGSNWSVNDGGNISFDTNNFNVNAPQSSFSSNVSVGGNLSCGGGRSRGGGVGSFTGPIRSNVDCIGGGVSLKGHTHNVINHNTTTPPN